MFTDTKNAALMTTIPQRSSRRYERCKLEKVWRPLRRLFALQSNGSKCKHCQNDKNHHSIKYQSIPNNVALNNAASSLTGPIPPEQQQTFFPKSLMVDLPLEDKSALRGKDVEQRTSLDFIAPLPAAVHTAIPQQMSLPFANEGIQVFQDSIAEVTGRTSTTTATTPTPTPFLQRATVDKTPVTTRTIASVDGSTPIPLLDKCNGEHCIYGSNCQHNHTHQPSPGRERAYQQSSDLARHQESAQEDFEEVLDSFRVLALTEALNDEQTALRHWLAKHSQTLV